jgi:hypothetical protein
MTLPSESRNTRPAGMPGGPVSGDSVQVRRFVSLESQLEQAPAKADRIARKHWPQAEREQYAFWIGILVIALLLILGMYLREVTAQLALVVSIVALIGLIVDVAFYLRGLQGRFGRQWSAMAADGELFRFLMDAGVVLGHPVEMGRQDEMFTTSLDIPFPDTVRAAETYLRRVTIADPTDPESPPGLYIPEQVLKDPQGSEMHRVYAVEYRGAIMRAFSIRVDATESGSGVTVGFMLRPSRAETRERVAESLLGRLQDRLIAAKILADIRDASGVDPIPIPLVEAGQPLGGPATSSA